MPGYGRSYQEEKSYTLKLTAAILGVLCALLLVLTGGLAFTQTRDPEKVEVSVSEDFQDNSETYYEDMNPVPYSSYVAAGNQS